MADKCSEVSHAQCVRWWPQVDFFEITGRMRLSFPMQNDVPIFNGMSLGFMAAPKVW